MSTSRTSMVLGTSMIAESKPTPRAEIAEWRQRELILATISCVARFGLGGASIDRIIAEAGVSRGLVRHHFGDKGRLLESTYRFIINEFQEYFEAKKSEQELTPLEQIHLWFEIVFRPPFINADYLATWFEFVVASRTDPGLRLENQKIFEWYKQYFTRLFNEIKYTDVLSFDQEIAADGLIALMDGLWLELLVLPEAFETERAIRICKTYVSSLLATAGQLKTKHNLS